MTADHFIILDTITLIRDSFQGSVEVYTKGSCVKFCMILYKLHKGGKILYDQNHAIFEYDGICFDIKGIAEKTKHHKPIEEYGLIMAYNMMNTKAAIDTSSIKIK